jgi:hypothetical protein
MSAAVPSPDLPGVTFVPKPFDIDQVLAVVARTLGDVKR